MLQVLYRGLQLFNCILLLPHLYTSSSHLPDHHSAPVGLLLPVVPFVVPFSTYLYPPSVPSCYVLGPRWSLPAFGSPCCNFISSILFFFQYAASCCSSTSSSVTSAKALANFLFLSSSSNCGDRSTAIPAQRAYVS
uniref:Uncharacterized protein n=1 Tax=Utricularia reniformis TaxID=192314 RepID=A0A1Y0B1A2_9LAMI|nr:hypothetical protein AEK19_MT0900 [Utricularia reniformis]ART31129.1 hypothetical protein AEK19_MT0900 [Utricularia reniformis]